MGVTNPDKVIFPRAGFTKRDLVDYYSRMAETMLPHIGGRPLTMQRFPDGFDEPGFYQKEIPGHFPAWVCRARVQLKGENGIGHQDQVVCNDQRTLEYLADQGCVTPHVWLSRADALERPDRIIFDLDPAQDDFAQVRFAARRLADVLRRLALEPLVMTTGSRGLHVLVVIERGPGFEETRRFARSVAERLASQHPDRITAAVRKRRRRGRLYVDWLRNAYGQHGVAPYALRPLDGAPVATPIDWSELSRVGARSYRAGNVFRRLGQKPDPWRDAASRPGNLSEALDRLGSLS